MALVAVLLLPACAQEANRTVHDSAGQLELTLLSSAERQAEAGKTEWRLREEGIVVSVQAISATRDVPIPRTLATVRGALETRFTEELDATFHSEACRAASIRAACFESRQPVGEGNRVLRRGLLLPLEDAFILVEVAGPEGSQADVENQARLLRTSLRETRSDS